MKDNTFDRTLFNIDILVLSDSNIGRMQEVTKLNVFESNTKIFDGKGLFSTNIFGPIGSTIRNEMPAYINLHVGIMHPLVYQHIVALKSFYDEIIRGTSYAKYDATLKELVPADANDGDTGYTFFISHIDKLAYSDNNSDQRGQKVEFVNKYGNANYLLSKWLIIPAGLRDYTIDDGGQPSEDEVNTLYRKMIATAGMINNMKISDGNMRLLDPIRVKMQDIANEIFAHFKTLLDGKNKFILGKWAKRAIMYGTRNVISPTPIQVTNLKSDNKIGFNDTVIGIYQFIQCIKPITMNRIHSIFINRLMNPDSDSAVVVDPTTMKSIIINIPVKKRDEWLSLEGLSGIIAKLAQDDIKTEPAMVDKYYLLLIYDDGKNVTVIFNTDDITEDMNPKYIRPITYIELMYIAIVDIKRDFPGTITRYPVASEGGIYPTFFYVKTTVTGRKVNLSVNGISKPIYEYPNLKDEFVNAVSPHDSHIARLVADYDGDKISVNALVTDESITEVKDMLKSKKYYITPNGELTYSMQTDTLDLVLQHMTGGSLE